MIEKSTRPIVVFLGPTLPQVEARQILEAIYLEPVAQGGIVKAVRDYDPGIILIIDGVFQSEPAVRHKEILWALGRGISVVGTASMGALRAAELYPLMYGSGLIYRWYRRYDFTPDDGVAVVHGPVQAQHQMLTIALVDLLITLRRAVRLGLMDSQVGAALALTARKINFRDRTLEKIVLGAARGLQWPYKGPEENLISLLKSSLILQKQRDAIGALSHLRRGAFSSPSAFHFTPTLAFSHDLAVSGITP